MTMAELSKKYGVHPTQIGTNHLPEVIQGVEFKDGIKQFQNAA
jgi:hypothetical protein